MFRVFMTHQEPGFEDVIKNESQVENLRFILDDTSATLTAYGLAQYSSKSLWLRVVQITDGPWQRVKAGQFYGR